MGKGFSQVDGIDYEETFSPVARHSSIRSILALTTHMGWKIHWMDVKEKFLNSFIEEELYIEQPNLLIHLIRILMCANSGEHYMVSNRHPKLGTLGSTVISLV